MPFFFYALKFSLYFITFYAVQLYRISTLYSFHCPYIGKLFRKQKFLLKTMKLFSFHQLSLENIILADLFKYPRLYYFFHVFVCISYSLLKGVCLEHSNIAQCFLNVCG